MNVAFKSVASISKHIPLKKSKRKYNPKANFCTQFKNVN